MPPSGPGHSVSDHDAECNAHRIASRRIAALEIIPVGFRRGAAIISWIRGELSDFPHRYAHPRCSMALSARRKRCKDRQRDLQWTTNCAESRGRIVTLSVWDSARPATLCGVGTRPNRDACRFLCAKVFTTSCGESLADRGTNEEERQECCIALGLC